MKGTRPGRDIRLCKLARHLSRRIKRAMVATDIYTSQDEWCRPMPDLRTAGTPHAGVRVGDTFANRLTSALNER